MATKHFKYPPENGRNHKACPNCGQLRTEDPWALDVLQYTKDNPDDYPHDTLVERINYLRSVTQELVSRLEKHNF